MEFRPVFYIIGFLLSALSILMCIPGIIDAYLGNDEWPVFIFTSLICLFVGVIFILANTVTALRGRLVATRSALNSVLNSKPNLAPLFPV